MVSTFILLLLTSTNTANAQSVTRKVCVSLDTEFTAIGPDGDYWNTNGVRRIRGVYTEILDNNSGAIDAGFALDSGPDRGCRTVTLDQGGSYTVTAFAEARVSNRLIDGEYDSPPTPPPNPPGTSPPACIANCDLFAIVDTDYRPKFAIDPEYYIDHDEHLWGMVMVGTWMAKRSNFGLPATVPLPYNDASCCTGTTNIEAATYNKYIIAHETGHYVGQKRDEDVQPAPNFLAQTLGCNGWTDEFGNPGGNSGHGRFTREYAHSSVVEGFANFVGSWAWNKANEPDCIYATLQYYDWDLDGTVDNNFPGSFQQYSCQGKPWDLDADNVLDVDEGILGLNYADVTDTDWLQDMVFASSNSCTGSLVNYSTEYDWQRFYWDLLATEGLSFEDVIDVYDLSNPRSMIKTGGGWIANPNNPFFRTRTAMYSLGFGVAYENQKHNGADH